MALYLYPQFVSKALPNGAFNTLFAPGDRTSWSGIYRCEACGHEVVHTYDKPLPPQNHHVHGFGKGPIKWRMIVTDHKAA